MHQWIWSPISATLISGQRDAVLVDALLTVEQAHALGEWVEAHGKHLITIYLTHGYGDHFFGLGALLEGFPTARALDAPAVVQRMHQQTDLRFIAVYVTSDQDRVIHPDAERFMARRMKATTREIDSCHASPVSHPQEMFELIVVASQGVRHWWCNEIVVMRMKGREQQASLQKKGRVETQACPVAWSGTGCPFLLLLAFPNGQGEQRDQHKTQRKDERMTQQDESTQPESAETTPTRFANVGEVRFAYRRFGNPAGTPLVLLQHFRGSMDNWDPALLNVFAKDRTVITFDNAGVGFSSGEVPDNVAAMAQYALDFLDALQLRQVDLLGFSLGGYIAQHLALHRPQLVRRLILAGTGPGKGEGTQDLNPTILDAASGPPSRNGLLRLFFEPSETSQAAGAAFWDRLQTRAGERDPFLTGPGVQAQRTALTRWDRTEDAAYPHLRAIAHPVLVAGGSHDLIIPTVNAFVLAQRLPNAQLILYPDSGHGFLFQYHTLFGQHATLFLES